MLVNFINVFCLNSTSGPRPCLYALSQQSVAKKGFIASRIQLGLVQRNHFTTSQWLVTPFRYFYVKEILKLFNLRKAVRKVDKGWRNQILENDLISTLSST